jgi:hypothetical protein
MPRKRTETDDDGQGEIARQFPSKQDILAFIQSSDAAIGRREIARAFAIKGPALLDLKSFLM